MTLRPPSIHVADNLQRFRVLLLSGLLFVVGGCASNRSPAGSSQALRPDAASQSSEQIITEWLQNRNVAEWILARVGGACWAVSQSDVSPQARFEALELRANFGSSCMSLMNGITPRSQIVGMTILSAMVHRVWVTEGQAAALFGPQAAPLEEALKQIQKGLLIECRRYCSEEEIDSILKEVETWRAAHPGKVDATYLRFDITTDEAARTLGKVGDDPKGLFGSLDGRLYNAILLGERLVFQLSRMPRLIEWHSEAAVAAALAQQEFQAAVQSLRSFERLEPVLTTESDRVQSTLNAMPERLTEALVHQPEIVGLMQTSRDLETRMGALEKTVETFDRTVAQLSERLGVLSAATEPKSVSAIAGGAMMAIMGPMRSIVFLLTGAVAALLVLQTVLRRWRS